MSLHTEPKAESLFTKVFRRRAKTARSNDVVPPISQNNGLRVEKTMQEQKSVQELAGLNNFTVLHAKGDTTAWDDLTDDDDDDDIDDDGSTMKVPPVALTPEEAAVVSLNNKMHINKLVRMYSFIFAGTSGSIWGVAVGGIKTIAAVGLTTTGAVTGGIFVGIPLAVGGVAWYFLNKNRKKMAIAKKTLKESKNKKDDATAKK